METIYCDEVQILFSGKGRIKSKISGRTYSPYRRMDEKMQIEEQLGRVGRAQERGVQKKRNGGERECKSRQVKNVRQH